MYTYTYDAANRLVGVSGSGITVSYGYNGLGDRLSETVNSQTTYYVMDLNAGLTQVLQDGTNTYLYGAGRIAQYDASGAEYFLGDALGSVRQLVDEEGNVTLAKGYEPYGEVLYSGGSGASSYGFTDEWRDGSTRLVYLRARWYAPGQGRFLTKDVWEGDYSRPISFNEWNYVDSNPTNRVDPSGYYGRVVHYNETLRWAKQVVDQRCPNCLRDAGYLLADWVAKGDLHIDSASLSSFTHIELHFKTHTKAWEDVRMMITNADPNIFGAALHRLQDYWSHTFEGYPPVYPGHALDSQNAGCVYNDCERPQNEVIAILLSLWVDGLIESPTHDALRNILGHSSSNLIGLTTSNLFDLWLRGQPGFPDTRKAASWKNRYGYDTDGYYPFTERDQLMIMETKEALTEYFDTLNKIDLCLFEGALYTKPTDEEILKQLNSIR